MDFIEFHKILSKTKIRHWREIFPKSFDEIEHGDLKSWLEIFNYLPDTVDVDVDLTKDTIQIGNKSNIIKHDEKKLIYELKKLHPWRKGPFDLFSIHIDTEWRSDFKWNRLIQHIQPLKDRIILDVGCGNGYHSLRMAGEGAKLVLGIDPYILFVVQFMIFKKYLKNIPVFVMPVGIEALPKNQPFFDTVFSMGVFYHRRSPFDHLYELKALLKNGGELVLETLVIDGEKNHVLVPPNRYAKMRNVWFIPSSDTMLEWLKRVGFKNPRVVDITKTTIEEQRKTEWMTYESLSDFLNPLDNSQTIENLPSPRRAIFLAEK